MALVERYVDPDATGAGTGVDWTNAYTSLNAWEAAEQTDLVSDGDNHTVHLRSSSGGDDTTAVTIKGWTADATHLITITQDDFPADGIYDDTKYVCKSTHSIGGANLYMKIQEGFVDIDKLQFSIVASGSAGITPLIVDNVGTAAICNIDRVIINVSNTSSGLLRAIQIQDSDLTVNITNSTIYGIGNAATDRYGVVCYAATSCNVFNCSIYDSYDGIKQITGTVTVTNCAVGNNTNDFNGTFTIDHCCSDDGDGTNAVAPNAGGWADVFTDPANGDFSLKLGSNCIDAGTNTGAPSTDIIDTARPQNTTTDIGAYEYVEASTGIVILRRRMECA